MLTFCGALCVLEASSGLPESFPSRLQHLNDFSKYEEKFFMKVNLRSYMEKELV